MRRPQASQYAFRGFLVFIIFSVVWILGSDYLLGDVTTDVTMVVLISIAKGLFYVLLVGLLFYWLLRRHQRDMARYTEELLAANRRLSEALEERELLVREMRHRIKNNLQMVSSLLVLQQGLLDDDGRCGEVLREVQHRIQAMALVHEDLSHGPLTGHAEGREDQTGPTGPVGDVGQAASLTAVAMEPYLRNLVQRIVAGYRHGGDPEATPALRLSFDLAPVTLSVGQAVPVGLIMNELVTNALQHAFPPRPEPQGDTNRAAGGAADRIAVALAQAGDEVLVRVADNGVGTAAISPTSPGAGARPGGMGLHLVEALTEQLGGTLERTPGPGSGFELRFRATPL